MLSLSLAVLFFLGIHLFISGTPLRARVVNKLGEKLYLILFSICSLLGLVWMILAYRSAPYIELWGQVYSGRWLSSTLIFIAFIFLTLGMLSRNPTAVGGENLLEKKDVVRGIFRISRHPFLVAIAVWSATHLIYNGDLGSTIFFGGFLLLALFGPAAIDKKMSHLPHWPKFAEQTSVFPFIAILDQRNSLEYKEFLNWRLVIAILVYIVVFRLHGFMFGVSPV